MSNPIPHPQGEPEATAPVPHAGPVEVDSFGGRVHVEWITHAVITPLGHLPFFTEFLRLSGRFRRVGLELPAAPDQPERPEHARRSRYRLPGSNLELFIRGEEPERARQALDLTFPFGPNRSDPPIPMHSFQICSISG